MGEGTKLEYTFKSDVLFGCEGVHSEFQALEVRRHMALIDKMSPHYFELPKLKGIDSINPGNVQDFRLALFKAETGDELAKFKENGEIYESLV